MIHRLAEEKDFSAVYGLYMDTTSNPYLTYDPMPEEDFRPVYNDLLRTGTLYVVEDEKEIISTYRLIPKTARQEHTLYLGSFTVKTSLQGKGFGSKILAQILNGAAAKGKIRVELTVDIHNAPAIALYKKCGFEIEGKVRKSYKLSSTNEYRDEYLMAWVQ